MPCLQKETGKKDDMRLSPGLKGCSDSSMFPRVHQSRRAAIRPSKLSRLTLSSRTSQSIQDPKEYHPKVVPDLVERMLRGASRGHTQ